MSIKHLLQTGQKSCHDAGGWKIDCAGSGQDAELSSGLAWPAPRFEVACVSQHQAGGVAALMKKESAGTVTDLLTGLTWTLDANPGEFPMDWAAAHEFVSWMNRDREHGYDDWRLPDRRELRSLISHQTRNPALPEGHPFMNAFMGWYWTATTAAINNAFAWYVHMEGGRTFYGGKNQYYLVWPVRGEGNGALPATGQVGDSPFGARWPEPRFEAEPADTVRDHLTGLVWQCSADLTRKPVLWDEALEAVIELNLTEGDWRLPNINELESLVDMSRHDPALPEGHPFRDCREVHWSSTTSMFEPDWAWALYLNKGAVGVGRKRYARFHVWAVKG